MWTDLIESTNPSANTANPSLPLPPPAAFFSFSTKLAAILHTLL